MKAKPCVRQGLGWAARPTLLLATFGIVLCDCKKEAEPAPIPVATTAAPVAADPSPPASAAVAASADTAAPTVVAGSKPPPPKGASIDACCSALKAIEKSGKDALAKRKAASAASVCPGI